MKTLYNVDISPYAARIRMQIYVKAITDIAFEYPEHWGFPKFRDTVPIGRIPALVIDGDTIAESEVIAQFLEETYPKPSLLGTTPRENAHIRMLARMGDIYFISNIFFLSRETGALSRRTITPARGNPAAEKHVVELKRNLKALDTLIGKDGFACGGRITLADCALVPGLFFVETIMKAAGVDAPIPGFANVAAYWAAIQKNEHAARTLVELQRGVDERREMVHDGRIDKIIADEAAAWAAVEAQG